MHSDNNIIIINFIYTASGSLAVLGALQYQYIYNIKTTCIGMKIRYKSRYQSRIS